MLLFLAASAFAQTSVTPPGDGLTTGTAYQISELGNLVWMGDTVASSIGKYYELTNDIDASDTVNWNDTSTTTDTLEGFRPIGTNSLPFTGSFDGGEHIITGLTINRPATDYIGLFGMIGSGGEAKNLALEGGTVKGSSYVGALAGQNNGTITNCYATGAAAGIADSCVGGLAGYNGGGTITNCYATGAVTGNGFTHSYEGGLVGYNYGATITNCYATGAVTGSGWGSHNVGGLAGWNQGTITNCYATGAATGTGSVYSSHSYLGGLAGDNESVGTITNCYATGGVGVVTGANPSSFSAGGLAGYNNSGTITNSYWDTESTGQATSAGGTGKTTAQMKQQATFQPGGGAGPNDWDFTAVWGIGATTNNGYPFLRVFYPPPVPAVSSFAINNGEASTTSTMVTLDNTCTGAPTEFEASEAADFSSAAWQTYATAPAFSLSAGNGVKTVYFKVKNAAAESSVTSDTIVLNEAAVVAPSVTSFVIDNDTTETTSRNVTLDNVCANAPAEYQASEAADFAGAAWQPYAVAPAFLLSSGNGTKTVYFKVRNSAGESAFAYDTISLNEAPAVVPSISSFAIDNGTTETTSRNVTLDNVCANAPTEYQASEAVDFAGAAWQPYAVAPVFMLSSGNGTKTVYLKVRNSAGESAGAYDTIALSEGAAVAPAVTSFALDNGAPETSSGNVTLNNACTNAPTEYLASEAADFSGAAWLPYAAAPTFALSAGNGAKTVYFKVRNAAGESAAASDTITFGVADFSFASQRIKSSHAETWSHQTQGVVSKDKYSFSASAQLPTTFTLTSVDADTTVTVMVGSVLFQDILGHAAKSSFKGEMGGSATFSLTADVNGSPRKVQTVKVNWSAKKILKMTLIGTPLAGTGAVVDNIVNLTSASDGAVAPKVQTYVAFGTVFGEDSGVTCPGWKKTKAASGAAGTNLTGWSVSGK